jgi:hypothetical protein
MGLLSPYVYKTRDGKKFWLHAKKRGKTILYYFSKEPVGAIFNIPRGYKVVKTPSHDLPMLKRGSGGLFGGILKKAKTEENKEAKQETK